MKILVTGANGFMGSALTKALLQRGDQVRILHRPKSDLSALQGLNYESALGDITDYESVLAATQGVEAVFHVAALIAYDKAQWDLMHKINFDGSKNIVQACKANKVRRLVETSSVVTVAEAPFVKGGRDGRGVCNETAEYNLGKYNLGYFES